MKIKDLAKYKTLDITQLSGSPWNTAEKVLGLDSGDTVVMANRMDDEAKQYTDEAIASALTSYYTKDEVDEIVADIDVTEQLANYYTKSEVDTANAAQDERIENNENDIADLQSGMVSKSELETAMADETARTESTYAKPSDIPDLTPYATKGWVESKSYVNGAFVDAKVNEAITNETARTESVYAKKSEIPDLDNYYTKSETDEAIEEAISGINLEGYWTSAQTKNYVDAEITGATASETARTESTYAKKSEVPSLDGYATEQYVDNAIAAIPPVDLSAYAKTTAVTQDIQTAIAAETARTESTYLKEHQSLADYSTTSEVEGMISNATDNLASKQWVEDQGYLTQHQDISGKLDASTFNTYTGATETVLDGKADISDIPDVSGFVTSGDVETQIGTAMAAETARTESVYAKKTYVDNAVNGLATEQYVDEAIAEIPAPDMSDYVQKAELTGSTRTEVLRLEGNSSVTYHIATTAVFEKNGVFKTTNKTNTVAMPVADAVDSEISPSGIYVFYFNINGVNYLPANNTIDTTVSLVEGGSGSVPQIQYTSISSAEIAEYYFIIDLDNMTVILTKTLPTITIVTPGVLDDYATKADNNTKLDKTDFSTYTGATATAIAAKQDTLVSGTNIKTINNQSLLGSGNIDIQGGGGGGGETVVELTKAQYEALDPPAADTTYIITDAEVVDLNDYAKASGLTELSATTTTALAGKADKANTTARNGYYFPAWNAQGIITGIYTQVYAKNDSINGNSYSVLATNNNTRPTIYAPTTVGTAGQPLLSDGSGAPSWGTYKFAFITQTEYDALTAPDATTIYFIIGD